MMAYHAGGTRPGCAHAQRTVFFVSDGTGITAETFGNSILAQFPGQAAPRAPALHRHARQGLEGGRGDQPAARGQAADRLHHPGRDEVRAIITGPSCKGLVLDMFRTFVEPLEVEFGVKSNHRVGRFSDASQERGVQRPHRGHQLQPGARRRPERAQPGQRRRDPGGRQPQRQDAHQLYLAMQHGIKAANYPLIPEDFERGRCRRRWRPQAQVLRPDDRPRPAGADPQRAPPGSKYASLENCRYEVATRPSDDAREGIAWLSSTHKSIEEIATTILRDMRPDRLIY
jgi:regulator of PEP synthase PpsR (kinase-PPPase family)